MKAFWIATLTFVVGMWVLLALPGATFDAIIVEDSWVENLGAAGLFLSSGCYAACFLRTLRLGEGRTAPMRTLSYLALAMLFVFGGGEEISWGQRIFGWGTPEALQQTNIQHETNLHNLAWMHGWLDMGRLFQIFILVFSVVVPLIAHRSQAAHRFFSRFMPVLPWQFGVPFAANFILSKIAGVTLSSVYSATTPFVQGVTELKETSYSVLCCVVGMFVYRSLPRAAKALRPQPGVAAPS